VQSRGRPRSIGSVSVAFAALIRVVVDIADGDAMTARCEPQAEAPRRHMPWTS
jgi:hypothetical protein